MLANLAGWFLIIIGVIFFLKPELLRKRLQRKSHKTARKILFSLIIVISSFIITLAFKTQGALSKILGILGIIGIVKGFLLIKGKLADKLLDLYIKQPVGVFRIWAVIQIAIGASILLLNR